MSQWLTPILPQGEIWTWHFVSGLMLFFASTAYVLYMARSGLFQRNATKKLRVLVMRAPADMKWAAVNVVLHWFIYGLIVVMFSTGIMLYLGWGGWWVYVHSAAAFVGLGYILVHVVSHYMFGGWMQLLRVFKPARLVVTQAVRPKPLLIGLCRWRRRRRGHRCDGLELARYADDRAGHEAAYPGRRARTIRMVAPAKRRGSHPSRREPWRDRLVDG